MKKRILIITLVALLLGIGVFSLFLNGNNGDTAVAQAYEEAVKLEYTGTMEEWVAALVGETVPGENQSAYLLACEKGYSGTFDQWMQALTGMTATDQSLSAYQLMRQNGFGGTLTEWLNTLVKHPEKLGHSENDGKTEYELACEYGFEGTYIEWLVSLVSTESN